MISSRPPSREREIEKERERKRERERERERGREGEGDAKEHNEPHHDTLRGHILSSLCRNASRGCR